MILNKIKYRLLQWLINDICKNSEGYYDECVLRYNIRVREGTRHTIRDELFTHAKKVWRIK